MPTFQHFREVKKRHLMIFMHLSDFLIIAQVEVLCVTRLSRDLSTVGVATPDYRNVTQYLAV